MRRFIVSKDHIDGSTATVTGSEAHHLSHVLRLKPSTRITLFDGDGTTYEGQISSLEHDQVKVTIDKITREDHNRPQLHLAQAAITGKKMDLVVQKATELGLQSITSYTSAYCSARTPPANRQERWQRIALESCKQCCRPDPPEIRSVKGVEDCLAAAKGHALKIIFWEELAELNLRDIKKLIDAEQPLSTFYMIGPEGGLTDREVAQAKKYGFLSVTLGPRILRAETAGIAAGAILQFLLGNMG